MAHILQQMLAAARWREHRARLEWLLPLRANEDAEQNFEQSCHCRGRIDGWICHGTIPCL